jgi:hypothetical protein
MIAILHTWGQTLTHHPHVHCVAPGGGLGPDGRWIACRPNFFCLFMSSRGFIGDCSLERSADRLRRRRF